eukprot:5230717-Amphidinium_carterae.2
MLRVHFAVRYAALSFVFLNLCVISGMHPVNLVLAWRLEPTLCKITAENAHTGLTLTRATFNQGSRWPAVTSLRMSRLAPHATIKQPNMIQGIRGSPVHPTHCAQ